jgi:hypothetical protein
VPEELPLEVPEAVPEPLPLAVPDAPEAPLVAPDMLPLEVPDEVPVEEPDDTLVLGSSGLLPHPATSASNATPRPNFSAQRNFISLPLIFTCCR